MYSNEAKAGAAYSYPKQSINGCADASVVTSQAPKRDDGAIRHPGSDAQRINQIGFSYLFQDGPIAPEMVDNLLVQEDGIMRYSAELASMYSRSLAIVLFRAAQIVYRGRNGHHKPILFDNQCVVQMHGMNIPDMPMEELEKTLYQLTEMGILTRYIAERNGENIFSTWFTFSDEDEYFPPHGKAKF